MPLSPSEVIEKVVGNYDFKSVFARIDTHLVRAASQQHGSINCGVAMDIATPVPVLEAIVAAYKEKWWGKVHWKRTSDQRDGSSLVIYFEA